MIPVLRPSLVVLLIAFLLASCGGGGGGGGASTTTTPATASQTPSAPVGSASTSTVQIGGVATFDSVPNPSGALVYAATVAKPIRGATVEIVSTTSDVVASTTTDDTGRYAVRIPANRAVKVRIRAEMIKAGAGPNWNVSVRDNTLGDALYVIETAAFVALVDITRDVHATSGWEGMSYDNARRLAGPFALMDTVYTAMEKAMTADAGLAFPPLRVYWSVNNVPYDGDIALGQVGGTFFLPDQQGGGLITVLGRQDVETDEYDASVIAHEWGHYYQWALSRDDSPGGAHSSNDRLDPRVAFSEGWGNAWSGIALGRSTYADSYGPAQGQGFLMDLANGPSSNRGWFRELSIQSVLWHFNDQAGFLPIHKAMAGPLKRDPALTTIYSFFSALATVSPGSSATLGALLSAQDIHAIAGDSFGVAETNAGGSPAVPTALPVYTHLQVGRPASACVSNVAGSRNKLGNNAYLRFDAPAARSYAISVVGPAGSDPDFTLYEVGPLAARYATGTTEDATLALAAGVHVLSIIDYANSGVQTCFNVTIN